MTVELSPVAGFQVTLTTDIPSGTMRDLVPHARSGHANDVKTRFGRAPAEVSVLVIHKVLRIEQADDGENLPPDQHAAARHIING